MVYLHGICRKNLSYGGKIMKNYPETIGNQKVFLDFDGENTFYENSDLDLNFSVTVKDSGISEERQQNILALLNEKYRDLNVTFTNEKPLDTEFYSTVFVGKTDDFADYGSFAGMAETIDKGNEIKNDDAFVMLDDSAADSEIIQVIDHELGHIIMGEEHETVTGKLEDYAAKTYDATGTVTKVNLIDDNNIFVTEKGSWSYRKFTFIANRGYGYINHYFSSDAGKPNLVDVYITDVNGKKVYDINTTEGTGYLTEGNTYHLYIKNVNGSNLTDSYRVFLEFDDYDTSGPGQVITPVAPSTDIRPFTPKNWSGPVVVSNKTGTTVNSSDLSVDQDIYVDMAVHEKTGIEKYWNVLYVDGVKKYAFEHNALLTNKNYTVKDINIGRLSAGWHTFKFFADDHRIIPETDESNNIYTKKFYVGASDLTVSKFTLSKETIAQNGTSVANITIKNIGDRTAKASKLYLHVEGKKIDVVNVAALGAGKSETHKVTLKGSMFASGYNKITVKADAANVLNEKKENNNKKELNILRTAPVKYSDLTISGLTASKIYILKTGSTKLSFTLKNSGKAASKACKIYIYDSKNKKIAGVNAAALAVGKSKTYSRTISGSKLVNGTNKITVKADVTNVIKESNENNNNASYSVYVGKAYDISLESVSCASSIYSNANLKITAKLKNNGNVTIGASKLYFYKNGKKLGGVNVAALAAGSSKSYSYTVKAGKLSIGSNEIVIKADATGLFKEKNESNNRVVKNITVKNSYDLAIAKVNCESSVSVSDSPVISVYLKNNGKSTIGASKLYFYKDGVKIGGLNVASLTAGSTKVYRYTVKSGVLDIGDNEIVIKADATGLFKENNESNNRVVKNITVENNCDLDMNYLNVEVNNPWYEDMIKISVDVVNNGDVYTPENELHIYNENGNLLERINVGSLSPSSSQTYSCMIPKTMFANGENTITVKLDATDKVQENNEDNNELMSLSFNVNDGYGISYAPENPALTAWDVRGYEDVNKDGFADLLLGNESDLSSWEDAGEAKITALCRELPGNGWEFAGVADFNGDGCKEILLYGGNETFKPDSDEKGKIFMPIA